MEQGMISNNSIFSTNYLKITFYISILHLPKLIFWENMSLNN